MYLSGSRNAKHAHLYADGTLGFLQTPTTRWSLEGAAVWALDNGCFTNAYPGDDAYIAMLTGKYAAHKDRCLFVAAPDVVGDARATLARSLPMIPRIRARGYPVALVAQDGMEHLERFIPWPVIDWLFLGGTTEWKLGAGAREMTAMAHRHGIRVHMGRVNSEKRLRYASHIGCDSADGTYLAYGPDKNIGNVLAWLRSVNDQGVLT